MGKQQFSYRITKNGKLFVNWHGEQGKREIVLKGPRAKRLASELSAMDPEQQQLALARATGNFKRGNERQGATRKVAFTMADTYAPLLPVVASSRPTIGRSCQMLI